jgi:hypothetical protein
MRSCTTAELDNGGPKTTRRSRCTIPARTDDPSVARSVAKISRGPSARNMEIGAKRPKRVGVGLSPERSRDGSTGSGGDPSPSASPHWRPKRLRESSSWSVRGRNASETLGLVEVLAVSSPLRGHSICREPLKTRVRALTD